MLLSAFRKVCALLKDGDKLRKGKIHVLSDRPEPLPPELCPGMKDLLASGARCAKIEISLWRLLRGNIPFFSLFVFFPDRA